VYSNHIPPITSVGLLPDSADVYKLQSSSALGSSLNSFSALLVLFLFLAFCFSAFSVTVTLSASLPADSRSTLRRREFRGPT